MKFLTGGDSPRAGFGGSHDLVEFQNRRYWLQMQSQSGWEKKECMFWLWRLKNLPEPFLISLTICRIDRL